MKKVAIVLCAMVLLLLPMLFGCAGGEPEYVAIALSRSNITLTVGDEYTVIASIYPPKYADEDIVWTSSNEDVVVCENGKIIAKGTGVSVIKAKSESTNATSMTVNVVANTAKHENLLVGDSIYLGNSSYAYIYDDGGVWTSTDPSVAVVEDGYLKALAPGKATIKISSGNNSVSACIAHVYGSIEESVSFDKPDMPIKLKYAAANTEVELLGIDAKLKDDGRFKDDRVLVTLEITFRKTYDPEGENGRSMTGFYVKLYSNETGYCNTYAVRESNIDCNEPFVVSYLFYADLTDGPRSFYFEVLPIE